MKKKTNMKIVIIIGSIITGFLIAYFLNYKADRSGYKLQELIFLNKGACYHIHHFMIFGIIILAIFLV